jgi:hypothetical protein
MSLRFGLVRFFMTVTQVPTIGYANSADKRKICVRSLTCVVIVALARIIENSGSLGLVMGDLALVVVFLSMLMVPCCLAVRNVRTRGSVSTSMPGVFAIAESYEDGEVTALPPEAPVDRRALAIQRSREIYFRTDGRPPQPDYGPPTDRDRGLGSAYRSQMAE